MEFDKLIHLEYAIGNRPINNYFSNFINLFCLRDFHSTFSILLIVVIHSAYLTNNQISSIAFFLSSDSLKSVFNKKLFGSIQSSNCQVLIKICYSLSPESLNRIEQLFIKYKFLCQPPGGPLLE